MQIHFNLARVHLALPNPPIKLRNNRPPSINISLQYFDTGIHSYEFIYTTEDLRTIMQVMFNTHSAAGCSYEWILSAALSRPHRPYPTECTEY